MTQAPLCDVAGLAGLPSTWSKHSVGYPGHCIPGLWCKPVKGSFYAFVTFLGVTFDISYSFQAWWLVDSLLGRWFSPGERQEKQPLELLLDSESWGKVLAVDLRLLSHAVCYAVSVLRRNPVLSCPCKAWRRCCAIWSCTHSSGWSCCTPPCLPAAWCATAVPSSFANSPKCMSKRIQTFTSCMYALPLYILPVR